MPPKHEIAQDDDAGPLAGVTVIDLTRALAGPYGTMLLGELGARIVKVEPPGGDQGAPDRPRMSREAARILCRSTGAKESIVLDLKKICGP